MFPALFSQAEILVLTGSAIPPRCHSAPAFLHGLTVLGRERDPGRAQMEDWTDVMYVAMYGCDEYSYGDERWLYYCEHPIKWGIGAAVYFIV